MDESSQRARTLSWCAATRSTRGSPPCSSPMASPKPRPPHERTNMSGDLPIGPAVPGWTARPRPSRAVMQGRFCRLEPLSPNRHADSLFDANALDREGRMWTYLFAGTYRARAEYHAFVEKCSVSEDPLF